HKPDSIGIELDKNGWADINQLITKINISEPSYTLDYKKIKTVVDTNEKKRFIISDDGSKIRASQGHSIEIDLKLEPTEPPEILYHGTAQRFLEKITTEGLIPKERQHVHLSDNIETAISVGQRYGKPVLLTIQASIMFKNGYSFFLSENNVWLTNHVPSEYILL
ncbi:MAG: RNA 2'-phosphotransferase, partial [Gammaproteobacteria bacterium]